MPGELILYSHFINFIKHTYALLKLCIMYYSTKGLLKDPRQVIGYLVTCHVFNIYWFDIPAQHI